MNCKRCGGIATKPKYWPCETCRKEIDPRAIELKAQGLTALQISSKLNAPSKYVYRVLRENKQKKVKLDFRAGKANFSDSYEAKVFAINYKGGECQDCGYCKNASAMAFHHIDPATKLFSLTANHIQYGKPELVIAELDKCVLLCHNCHQETHNSDWVL